MAYSTISEGSDTILRKQINDSKSIEEKVEENLGMGIYRGTRYFERYTRASGKRQE